MKGTSGILLLLLAMFLLMLAFSGRFHDILTAAFPSLGTDSSGTSGSSADPTTNVGGLVAGGGGGNLTAKTDLPAGGLPITPLLGGGFQYVTG